MSNLTPQAIKVLDYMVNAGPISSLHARSEFRCEHLASRISDLRKAGIPIGRRFRKSFTGQRYVEYFIDYASYAASNFCR